MWDGTPWMIGGGARHSTNVARLLAYVAFGGEEGIISPLDLEVRPLSVPGAGIRVAPGACSILNRNSQTQYEAYAARLPREDQVQTVATGSGSGRTDLVVARVKNGFLPGEPYPEPTAAEMADGTAVFVDTHIIPGIAGVTPGEHPTPQQVRSALGSMSAIPLASIALPASTGTVNAQHLRDLRSIAQFREHQVLRVARPVGVQINKATAATVASVPLDVPTWATHFTVAVQATNAIRAGGANFAGNAQVRFGSVVTASGEVDDRNTEADRLSTGTGEANVALPVAMRGTSQTLAFEMFRHTHSTGLVAWDRWSTVQFSLVFHSQPEKR